MSPGHSEMSYARKLVTAGREEGGVSWGCSRLHFSSKGVIRRVGCYVVKLLQPGSFADPLTEVLRNGARALLSQAIEAEVAPNSSPSMSI